MRFLIAVAFLLGSAPAAAEPFRDRRWGVGASLADPVGFCVDRTAFSAMLRAPIGVDLRIGAIRTELGFEAVPALRLAPAAHATFLGGFFVRFYP